MQKYSVQGISLVEIVFAVAIGTVLIAALVPLAVNVLEEGWETQTRDEMVEIRDAIDLYFRSIGELPTTLADLTTVPQVAPDGWDGPYMAAGLNDDGFTNVLCDGWGTPYLYYALDDDENTRYIRSLGPNRTDDGGGGDDIVIPVELAESRRDQTVRELLSLNGAIEAYNANNLPHDPLPSDLEEIVETLQEQSYLDPEEDPENYLTDGWGTPYEPGPEPVLEVSPATAVPEEEDGGGDDGGEGGDDDGGIIEEIIEEIIGEGDDDDGGNGNGNGGNKVVICHIPPGNPDAQHTIKVGASAVAAHLAHGDHLGPCCPIVLDLETEDDQKTPLIDGQEIDNECFGVFVTVSGTGFGPAVFDSTIGGPNDPGRDPDLLVDSGNVLIIQENGTQSVPGVFDYPDDDGGGGTLIFDFHQYTEVESITMVDIDDGGHGAAIRLLNDDGEERYFETPGGFTEDIEADGPPGVRTIDLTTLDPQPGFTADSWATETPRFDATRVIRIEVSFAGSGAVDNITCCPNGEEFSQPGACVYSFWLANPAAWSATGYDPSDSLSSVFDVPGCIDSCSPDFDTATLGDALGFSGWSGKCGKARKLYRQAVTALLNAAHPDVNFPMDEDQVISTADIALLSCHNGTMNGQAADFEDVNEAGGCPFD